MNESNHSTPWITVVIVIAIVAWTTTSSAQPGQIADEPAVKQETEKKAKDKDTDDKDQEPPKLDVKTPIEALRKALPPTARPPSPPVRLRPPKNEPGVPVEAAIAQEPSPNEKAAPEKKAAADDTAGAEFQPISPRTKVTFNLEEADLPELVRLISNMTGRRFILPGKIRSIKATVFAPTKVTAAEAYRAFLSILEVNGLTVVPTGRYLKITETGGVESQPLQIYGDGTGVPAVDRYITRLHYLENVAADDVTSLLSRFKSKEGNLSAYAPTNMLIITDTGTQIRRMMKLIRAVDVPRTGTQTWIEPIHYANASEMAARLQEIFPIGDAPGGSSTTRPRPRPAAGAKAAVPAATVGKSSASGIRNIIADERTNSLIIIASERAYLKILEMIRQLDIPLEGEGRIHVHYVQNSAATDIAAALSALIGGGTAGRTAAQQRRTAGRQTTPTPVVASGTLFEGEIRVTAYEPSNALVITSSFHDYAALKRVIERLDAPRRQVFIEAVILELGLSRTTDLGISYHAGAGDFPTDGSLSVFGFDAGSTIGGLAGAATDPSSNFLTGLALGVQGPTIENSQQLVGFSVPGFGVAVTALAQSGDVNILSTPHIMAMDNVEAEISVGENIPLQTSGVPAGALTSFSGLATGAAQAPGASLTGAGGIPRQDVGTTIRITPHINEANEMRLEIEEEISEKGATEGTLGVVSISRRTARTELMVRDQQTIVIGGLMREATSTSETKVPVLGDIPILGALFRKQSDDTRKTNLLLILTPYIIRDPSDLRSIFERKMRERQEFIDRFFVLGDDDYEPVVDYSRTRGLVTEIINEITVVEQEMALAQAAMAKPALNHIPRTPIGTYEASVSESVVIVPEGQTITEPPPSRSPNVPPSEPGTPPSRP